MITKEVYTNSNPIPDWDMKPLRKEEGKDVFSVDNVIDAYLSGRRDQLNHEIQLKFEKLGQNLETATNLSKQIFDFIKENHFRPNKVYLKIKDIYSFTSFFLINEDDYCDDNFLKVYEKTIEIKKQTNKSNTFDYTTILTPYSEFFDSNSLLSDGYILSYDGEQKS